MSRKNKTDFLEHFKGKSIGAKEIVDGQDDKLGNGINGDVLVGKSHHAKYKAVSKHREMA